MPDTKPHPAKIAVVISVSPAAIRETSRFEARRMA
jgi:hypothetical protein